MAEQFHAVERRFGIAAYASSPDVNPGFAAVLKARYADFVVHEVDEDGNVAALTTLSYDGDGVDADGDASNAIVSDGDSSSQPSAKKTQTLRGVDDAGSTACAPDATTKKPVREGDDVNEGDEGAAEIGDVTVARGADAVEGRLMEAKFKGTPADEAPDDPTGKIPNDDCDGDKASADTDASPSRKQTKTTVDTSCADVAASENGVTEATVTLSTDHVNSDKLPIGDGGGGFGEAERELSKLVGADAASESIAVLRYWTTTTTAPPRADAPPSDVERDGSDDHASSKAPAAPSQPMEKYYALPPMESKEKRRAVHLLLRGDLLSPHALADTAETKEGPVVRIWHRRFEKEMPNYGKFGRGHQNQRGGTAKSGGAGRGKNKRKKPAWPAGRPDFLRFVLYKENVDTSTACGDVARVARLNPRGPRPGVGCAGMKDKRGVTSQFCTVYRREPMDVLGVNRVVGLGRGGGNRSSGAVSVVRAGNVSFTNRELTIGRLKGNRFDVVLRNVDISCNGSSTDSVDDDNNSGKEGPRGAAHDDLRMAAATETLARAAKVMKDTGFINYFGMQRFGKFHDTHEVGLAVLKGDFEAAVNVIMREKPDELDRTADARRRWANRFQGVDLTEGDNGRRAARDAEMRSAKSVLRDLGRFMQCEVRLMQALSRTPRDYRAAFRTIPKYMKMMFLHAVQSLVWNKAASHRIESGGSTAVTVGDLVLVGDEGGTGLKGKQVHTVTEEDVRGGKFGLTDVVIPLIGSKVEYPTNSTGSYIDELLKEEDLTKSTFVHKDKELTLGGDYRKLICRPDDFDWVIKRYDDPLQPLIETDLMKLSGEELVHNEEGGKQKGKILGMVVGFTLPPSSYATVALRELMKRPTAGDYQKMLMLEGRCEKNLGKINVNAAAKRDIS